VHHFAWALLTRKATRLLHRVALTQPNHERRAVPAASGRPNYEGAGNQPAPMIISA
jgi:hypothetical protein